MKEAICFVSVAFGEKYIEQMDRLKASIELHHPESSMLFWKETYPGPAFLDSLYGFKPHAIEKAIRFGATKVIWLDPACIVVGDMSWYFKMTKHYGVVAVADDNLLGNYTSNQAIAHFGETRDSILQKQQRLVGGSLYAFDFDMPLAHKVQQDWLHAERLGLFGSQVEAASGLIESHRNDESCMAHCLYANNTKPIPYELSKYNEAPNPLIIKKHFK